MIAKAKVISHGANAIRYSVDKDKAEIVKTNLLPDDISPTAMWARMLALQKKFEGKLNRYHPLKRNMIRIEVSPTSEETQGWTMEDWQRLADDFIREFDVVDLSAKSKRKSAKATNLKDSQYVVALHRPTLRFLRGWGNLNAYHVTFEWMITVQPQRQPICSCTPS